MKKKLYPFYNSVKKKKTITILSAFTYKKKTKEVFSQKLF